MMDRRLCGLRRGALGLSSLLLGVVSLLSESVALAQKAGPVVNDPRKCPSGMTAQMESPGGCAPCVYGSTNCPCARPTFRCYSGKVPSRLSDADERALRQTLCRASWDRERLDELIKPTARCGPPSRPTWMDLAEIAPQVAKDPSPQHMDQLLGKFPSVACELTSCWPSERAIAVSPDGKWLVTGGSVVRLWQLPERKRVAVLGNQTETTISLSFSPDSSLLATSTFQDGVRVWRIPSGELVLRIPTGDLNNVIAFVNGGRSLFAGGINGRARMFSVTDGSGQVSLGGRFALQTVAASPAGDFLYAADRLWNAQSGQIVRSFDNGQGGYLCAAFSADGKRLATGGGSYIQGQDYAVRLFEADTGKLLHSLTGHTRPVHAVAFSPDGRLLASGGSDGELRLWRTADGSSLDRQSYGSISGLVFVPSGDEILLALSSGGIARYQLPKSR